MSRMVVKLGRRGNVLRDGTLRCHPGEPMFHFFGSVLGLAIAVAASMVGYWQARQFTQNKLRFVDAVHKMGVPLLAGLGAALVAMPIVWILPLVGTGTALLFGLGVALGVSAGAKEIRKRIGTG